MATVTMDIPEDIADLMVCDNKSDELRRNALLLYPFIKNETISHGRAAEILGIFKWELIELYGSEGIPYIDQSWEEAEQDAARRAHSHGGPGSYRASLVPPCSHTSGPSGAFSEVHAPGKNDQTGLPLRRQILRS